MAKSGVQGARTGGNEGPDNRSSPPQATGRHPAWPMAVHAEWASAPGTVAWDDLWWKIFSEILQSSKPPLPQDSEKEVKNG